MNILLVLPAAPQWRVTQQNGKIPRLKMGRFSILSLTTIAALTPEKHTLTICDENIEAIDLNSKPDLVGISFMTGLAPRAYELAHHFRRRGTITDRDWSHYDFRHSVFQPKRLTPQRLQDGAAWLYDSFYRLDRIILRSIKSIFSVWDTLSVRVFSPEYELPIYETNREDVGKDFMGWN